MQSTTIRRHNDGRLAGQDVLPLLKGGAELDGEGGCGPSGGRDRKRQEDKMWDKPPGEK